MENQENPVITPVNQPEMAQEQPLEANSSNKAKKLLSKSVRFGIIGVVIIFLVALTHFTWWTITVSPEIKNPETVLQQPVQQEVPEARTPYTDTQISWQIINTENNTSILEKNEYDTQVVYQAPYLYFHSDDNYDVVQLNLETGEEKVIYTENSQEEVNRRTINRIQLVNNTLFFTTGGYMQGGELFYLNSNREVQSLNAHEMMGGGGIEEIAGRYWLIGGEGDSCWGQSRYSLLTFDPQPIVTPKIESHFGCNDGEQVLVTLPDKFLMTEHTTREDIPSIGFPASVFGSIFTRAISNPEEKTELVAAADMPEQVVEVNYIEDKNQVWMLGNEPALYDITSNQVRRFDKPLPFIPQSWGSGEWMLTDAEGERIVASDNGYCIEQLATSDRSFIKGYVLNFNDLKVEELTATCSETTFPMRNYDAETKKHIEKTFAELKLPAKYTLEISEKEVSY